MAYTLNKPYTENEKAVFIIEYHQNRGMALGETSYALVALEPWEIIVNDEIVDNTEEYNKELFEEAKAAKKQEALSKAYAYEKVGTFPYRAESVTTGEQVDVHIEFKPDNLTKFQGYVLGYLTQTITGKVTWLSAEDIAIYCTEQDCKDIIQLIAYYDSKLWETDYTNYLKMIDECLTVEGIKRIVIDYEALNGGE